MKQGISSGYYFNARWYDAQAGRFITKDPARDGTNWYLYTLNNPLIFVNPSGLAKEKADDNGTSKKSLGDRIRNGWEKAKPAVKNFIENQKGKGSSRGRNGRDGKDNHNTDNIDVEGNQDVGIP
ncbi:RHS repeat-associated core domain-containing protein [Spirochaeta cellobiosiphila]|uniref:RHS repeat-associated core domain-containing protein n=1 Tax=Spirochaeta cellobiosiphila TaxID=504483 RepID=UPI000417B929|nr:RHS repeat-associated core domain-containing protein [Spirochaeta cellobiosiphila]